MSRSTSRDVSLNTRVCVFFSVVVIMLDDDLNIKYGGAKARQALV